MSYQVIAEWAALPGLTAAQEYVQRQCVLHLHFSIRAVSDADARQFCAVVERKGPGRDDFGGAVDRRRSAGGAKPWPHVESLSTDRDDRSVAVFVHDPEAVQYPERIESIVVPSVVRLKRLDQCRSLPTHVARSLSTGLVHRFVVRYRKLGLWEGVARPSNVQKLDEVVEGGPRLMNDVAHEDSPSGERQRLQHLQAMDFVAGYLVKLSSDSIHLAPVEGLAERLNLICERLQVFTAAPDEPGGGEASIQRRGSRRRDSGRW